MYTFGIEPYLWRPHDVMNVVRCLKHSLIGTEWYPFQTVFGLPLGIARRTVVKYFLNLKEPKEPRCLFSDQSLPL